MTRAPSPRVEAPGAYTLALLALTCALTVIVTLRELPVGPLLWLLFGLVAANSISGSV